METEFHFMCTEMLRNKSQENYVTSSVMKILCSLTLPTNHTYARLTIAQIWTFEISTVMTILTFQTSPLGSRKWMIFSQLVTVLYLIVIGRLWAFLFMGVTKIRDCNNWLGEWLGINLNCYKIKEIQPKCVKDCLILIALSNKFWNLNISMHCSSKITKIYFQNSLWFENPILFWY